MTKIFGSRHIGLIAIGFGIMAMIIYLLMIKVTLAHIQAISGLVPFDMRPLGYSPTDAATLLDALGADGRIYYLSRQIPLDMVYPALMALTLMATITWFGQRIEGRKLVRLGLYLSVSAAFFDYAENLGIVAMIWSWSDTSELLIKATSTASVLKSVLTTFAVLTMLATGLIWAFQRRTLMRA